MAQQILELPGDEPATSPKLDGETASPVTAHDVRLGIKRRYGAGWMVLHEVANHLGHLPSERSAELSDRELTSKRYLDTVAVGMYRSTGYAIVGHEIKVSRADWLAELRKPKKAAAFDSLVTQFFLVCPSGVAQIDELPPGWGMLTYYPSCMQVARHATDRGFDRVPRSFVSALLARCNTPVKAGD